MVEGHLSPSLDSRISPAAPPASLPTPPSPEPPSPDASRFAIDHLCLSKEDLASVAGRVCCISLYKRTNGAPLAESLCILLEFYSAQDIQGVHPYLSSFAAVSVEFPQFFSVLPSSARLLLQQHPQHGPGFILPCLKLDPLKIVPIVQSHPTMPTARPPILRMEAVLLSSSEPAPLNNIKWEIGSQLMS